MLSPAEQKLLDDAVAQAFYEAETYKHARDEVLDVLKRTRAQMQDTINDMYSQGVGVGLVFGAIGASVAWGAAWYCFAR